MGPGQPAPAAEQSGLAVLDDQELHRLGVAAEVRNGPKPTTPIAEATNTDVTATRAVRRRRPPHPARAVSATRFPCYEPANPARTPRCSAAS